MLYCALQMEWPILLRPVVRYGMVPDYQGTGDHRKIIPAQRWPVRVVIMDIDTLNLEDILSIDHLTFNKYEEYTGNFDNARYIYQPDSHEFSYGCLSPMDKISAERVRDILCDDTDIIITPDYMTGSDYSGTTVELSNYEVFREMFGDLPGVYLVHGGHSTFTAGISLKWLLDPTNQDKADEIINTLRGLSDYPLIDDEHLSNMECEKERECVLDSFMFADCIREFRTQHGLILGDGCSMDGDLTDDQKWDLYRLLSERSNSYPVFEDNGYPYIDWERIVKSWRAGDLTALNIPHSLESDE